MVLWRKLSAVMAMSFFSAMVGAAEGSGFYAGAGIGLSHYEDEGEELRRDLAASGLGGSVDTDNDALGWKLFGGYQFNHYFGAELGYVDLGEESVTVRITSPADAVINAEAQVRGFSFAGTVGYPVVTRGRVFGKVGGFLWDSDADARASVAGTSPVFAEDDGGVDVTFGVGATYQVLGNFSVRLEWERFHGLSGTDVDLFGAGLQYAFH